MDSQKMTFEQAMGQLEKIVSDMEKGEMTLDESIEYFQKGMELSKYCSTRLDEVEKKISLIVEDEKGNIQEEKYEGMQTEDENGF